MLDKMNMRYTMTKIFEQLNEHEIIYDGIIMRVEPNQTLNEMADVMSRNQNKGFLITVFSNDHEPPHAHILTLERKEISQMLITEEPPKTVDDIKAYRYDDIDADYKDVILKWAYEKRKNKNYTQWEYMVDVWHTFQDSK